MFVSSVMFFFSLFYIFIFWALFTTRRVLNVLMLSVVFDSYVQVVRLQPFPRNKVPRMPLKLSINLSQWR